MSGYTKFIETSVLKTGGYVKDGHIKVKGKKAIKP
jgi:hypothetical protein